MPKNGDFKKLVRARMVKTAESYAIARMRLLGGARDAELKWTPKMGPGAKV
jgi:hypothetical protein